MKLLPSALLLLAVCTAEAAPPTPPPPAGCDAVNLNQGWTRQQSEDFWFTTQGSRMMPYSWFLALEMASPGSQALFSDSANMDRYGFIRVGPSEKNRDGLPLGFAKDVDAVTGEQYAGLTCAACHTGSLVLQGKRVIVEGGPAMTDFWMFLSEAVSALQATVEQPDKFQRFSDRVHGDGSLKSRMQAKLSDLKTRLAQNSSPTPFGFGRVDAFGHIFTRVLAQDLGVEANAKPPYAPAVLAPVSYPFVWDTPQHDVVQWNGSAPNTFATGALGRNVGEVLGVFGELKVTPPWMPFFPRLAKFSSSANLENLYRLENMVRTLWSPVWPRDCMPLADAATIARGRTVYESNCVGCHRILEGAERVNPNRKIVAQMKTLDVVGTDPTMAMNFTARMAKTGPMKGTLNPFHPLKFGDEARGLEILLAAVNGIVLKGVITGDVQVDVLSGLRVNPLDEIAGFRKALDAAQVARYKARPLNGIWATAPYLHNGSVPTLADLLTPENERPWVFWVGSREFDPVRVGLVVKESVGLHRYDTSVQGNWRNGHTFGTQLPANQKKDLLEFLKTL